MKLIKKILLALLIVLVVAQFFGPEKNEGDYATIESFITETKPSPEVKGILQESCFDCHSDVTRYPWYSGITPVNYWLADHVEEGKEHFDVSQWSAYSVKKKDHKLDELIEMVEEKEMPLNSYTWTHTEARLSDAQIKAVIDWAKGVRTSYKGELSNN